MPVELHMTVTLNDRLVEIKVEYALQLLQTVTHRDRNFATCHRWLKDLDHDRLRRYHSLGSFDDGLRRRCLDFFRGTASQYED
jgi:hypothetical protein